VWKTKWLGTDPVSFLRVLVAEIDAIKVGAWSDAGWAVSFRFNVLSDVPWEVVAPWLVRRIADRGIALMDYTKWPTARRPGVEGYVLCQSVNETTTDTQVRAMAHPVVVFDVKRGRPLPAEYLGRRVIDGDLSDARHLDPVNVVIGLRFKAVTTTDRMAAVASGFVRVA
jgi:hypothetical protein